MNNGILKDLDSLFQDTPMLELHIEQLVPYHDHLFALYKDERLENMMQSIRDLGIISPIIVRPMKQQKGVYEILAGHNRVNAARLVGITAIPSIIKEHISDDEAKWIVTESNLMQRSFSDMNYSERAVVLYEHHKMLSCQGKRMDLIQEINKLYDQETLGQFGKKLGSREKVGKEFCLSPRTVSRYLRIYKLDNTLKELLDKEIIAFTVAESISYLRVQEQQMIAELIQELNIKISIKQAEELRTLSKDSEITMEILREILGRKKKKAITTTIRLETKLFEKYFNNKSKDEISLIVANALKEYHKV